jgi:hypothetical protein
VRRVSPFYILLLSFYIKLSKMKRKSSFRRDKFDFSSPILRENIAKKAIFS